MSECTQFHSDLVIPHRPGHLRQRPEVICICGLGCEQGEDQIDALAIRGFEIYRLVQPGEHADNLVQAFNSGVRDRHAIPHGSRSQLLPGNQAIHDGTAMQTV